MLVLVRTENLGLIDPASVYEGGFDVQMRRFDDAIDQAIVDTLGNADCVTGLRSPDGDPKNSMVSDLSAKVGSVMGAPGSGMVSGGDGLRRAIAGATVVVPCCLPRTGHRSSRR